MPTLDAAEVPKLIRGLQERTAHALPAAVVSHIGGWWLRYADSAAWWASAVLPHGDTGPQELPDKIRFVENFYAGHGTPARFQVSPAASPATLDDALAQRGYRLECPMSLQSAPAARVLGRLPAEDARIRVEDQPAAAWFGTWHAVHAAGSAPGPEWDMLARVGRPSAYVSVLTGADVIAVGRAVAAGAAATAQPADEHGWRLGRITDPSGHEWEIGRPLGAWPPP